MFGNGMGSQMYMGIGQLDRLSSEVFDTVEELKWSQNMKLILQLMIMPFDALQHMFMS